MFRRRIQLIPRSRRGALRTMFVITCMPVGGAETLLVNLVRKVDRQRILPELCCLKYFGPLGDVLAAEVPAFTGLLAHKYDLAVLGRLTRLLKTRRIDAVITVGTGGDKMFWGRLAAWRAGVPVILSALHSTGLPDRVELPNRLLAPLTDAFIAVADAHGRYLTEQEGCPAHKVRVIANGVDTARYRPLGADSHLRAAVGLAPAAPVVGIVAALRPEKHHECFLRVARRVRQQLPECRFLIVGDGERRADLEGYAQELGVAGAVHFLGTRQDIPELLALVDVFLLTSHMEANPVSILEALACSKPVVAPRVGSIAESVQHGASGYLAPPGDEEALARYVLDLLADPAKSQQMGRNGREHVVRHASLESMVEGYAQLIEEVYDRKVRKACPAELSNLTHPLEAPEAVDPTEHPLHSEGC